MKVKDMQAKVDSQHKELEKLRISDEMYRPLKDDIEILRDKYEETQTELDQANHDVTVLNAKVQQQKHYVNVLQTNSHALQSELQGRCACYVCVYDARWNVGE